MMNTSYRPVLTLMERTNLLLPIWLIVRFLLLLSDEISTRTDASFFLVRQVPHPQNLYSNSLYKLYPIFNV
jgi:hypothetical protein